MTSSSHQTIYSVVVTVVMTMDRLINTVATAVVETLMQDKNKDLVVAVGTSSKMTTTAIQGVARNMVVVQININNSNNNKINTGMVGNNSINNHKQRKHLAEESSLAIIVGLLLKSLQ